VFRTVGFFEHVDTSIGNSRNVVALGLGDLDGDKRADAVVCNSANELNVLISKGDGSFATGVAYPLPNIGGGPRSMVVGDLTGDGRVEVIVGDVQQNYVSVFYNQGDGRLQAISGNTVTVNCQPVAMVLYDMNRDSLPDLVVACANPNEIHVLKNRGAQNGFDAPYTLAYDQPAGMGNAPAPRSLVVGELNGDGAPDIAVGTDSDLRILNSPNEGPRASYMVSVPLTMRVTGLGLGDLNGNGTSDLAVLTSSLDVRGLEYASGGTYNQFVAYQGVGVSGRTTNQGLGVGDFLKTGRSDMVVTLPNPSEIKLVVNRGELGNVASPTASSYQYKTGVAVSDNCLAVGDVTGDGLPDLALRNGAQVSVFVNASLY
jgi:hypothetical protein